MISWPIRGRVSIVIGQSQVIGVPEVTIIRIKFQGDACHTKYSVSYDCTDLID